jgi:ubiquinone/menaquinone biosynthesis C-methylase UbiE
MRTLPKFMRRFMFDGTDLIISSKILEIIGDAKGKTVGDIGCGYGLFSEKLAKDAKMVYGGDIRGDVVDSIKNVERKNLKFVQMDAQKLPFKDNTFDVLVYKDVLEHIKNDKKVISEARRVLKKNGIVIFSVPNNELPDHYDFPITRMIRKTPLREHHIIASSKRADPRSFTDAINKSVGHVRSYDKKFFEKINGLEMVGKYNVVNGMSKYASELLCFRSSFDSTKKMFIPLKILSMLLVFPYVIDYMTGSSNKDAPGFGMLIVMKKTA